MEYTDLRMEEKKEIQQERMRILRKQKFRRKLLSFGLVCVLLLLTIAISWLYGHNQGKQNAEAKIKELTDEISRQDKEIQDLIETPIIVNPVAPEINLEMIYSEIKEIGELTTVEYLFTDAAKFSDSKQFKDWNIPFTEKTFVLKWNGIIKAGVQLGKISIEIKDSEDEIIVSMPQAQILSYEVDNDSVEVLDEQDNLFNNITISDKIKFDAATEKAMKQRAIENGILEKAQESARKIITGLMIANPAIGDSYQIKFVITEN